MSQYSEAFLHAAERFVREFGNGPWDGLKTVGDTYGKGFAMIANVTRNHCTLEGIPDGHICIYRNGLPAGIINPFGGSIISLGEPGKAEDDFIKWCKSDGALS